MKDSNYPNSITGWVLFVLRHPSTVPIIFQIGPLALLCWILWYGISTEMPRVQREFHMELSRERDLYREHITSLRSELSERKADLQRTQKAINDNQKAILDSQRVLLELLKEIKEHLKEHPKKNSGAYEPIPMPSEVRS